MRSANKNGEFRLTRNFALASGLVILLAAIALAYVTRELTVHQLQRVAERNNSALTQAFANQLWPNFAAFVDGAWQLSAEDLRAHPRTAELHEAVRDLMVGTRVLKVKLYDLRGTTAYSTAAEQIGADYSDNPRYRAALAGRTVSKLERRETFNSFDGPLANRWILSSYVPIRPGGAYGPIEGVAEIYSDVSKLVANQRRFEALLIGVIGIAFLFVFAILLATVWRADQLIQRHNRAKIELAGNAARAEAASRAKTTFLTNLSHELRTPLNAIIGFSEMIEGELTGPIGTPHYKDYAADIKSSGRHLLGIIDSVLDLVEVESDKMTIMHERLDPAEPAGSAISMLQAQAAAKDIRLVLEADRGGQPIVSDRGRILQILVNLVSNAIKFSPDGGVVTLSVASVDGMIRFEVADCGIGIREEDIALALAPFSQVDSSLARSAEGTGLGLPLSVGLAELLGGGLEIYSTHGVGTTVRVSLRDLDDRQAAGAARQPAAA